MDIRKFISLTAGAVVTVSILTFFTSVYYADLVSFIGSPIPIVGGFITISLTCLAFPAQYFFSTRTVKKWKTVLTIDFAFEGDSIYTLEPKDLTGKRKGFLPKNSNPLGHPLELVALTVTNAGNDTLRFKNPELKIRSNLITIAPFQIKKSNYEDQEKQHTYSLESGDSLLFYYLCGEIIYLLSAEESKQRKLPRYLTMDFSVNQNDGRSQNCTKQKWLFQQNQKSLLHYNSVESNDYETPQPDIIQKGIRMTNDELLITESTLTENRKNQLHYLYLNYFAGIIKVKMDLVGLALTPSQLFTIASSLTYSALIYQNSSGRFLDLSIAENLRSFKITLIMTFSMFHSDVEDKVREKINTLVEELVLQISQDYFNIFKNQN